MKFQVEEIRPYTTTIKSGPKAGQQGTMYFIKTSDGQDMSTWDDISKYKQGDYLEGTMEISDKKDKNGQNYKNFKLPRRNLYAEIDEIKQILKDNGLLKQVEESEEEVDISDIPF